MEKSKNSFYLNMELENGAGFIIDILKGPDFKSDYISDSEDESGQ